MEKTGELVFYKKETKDCKGISYNVKINGSIFLPKNHWETKCKDMLRVFCEETCTATINHLGITWWVRTYNCIYQKCTKMVKDIKC